MTNKCQCYLLKLQNKNCQNIKRLPHSFYTLKVKCISIFFLYIFVLQFCLIIFNNDICTHVTKYSYFEFQLFKFDFTSLEHNATLSIVSVYCPRRNTCFFVTMIKDTPFVAGKQNIRKHRHFHRH